MISIQRCSTVSFPHSKFNQILTRVPSWSLFLLQYMSPIPFVANMFFLEMYFDGETTLNVVISRSALENKNRSNRLEERGLISFIQRST
ncbi:hypothetical protein COOONC_12308 [Cooperia oncophora]